MYACYHSHSNRHSSADALLSGVSKLYYAAFLHNYPAPLELGLSLLLDVMLSTALLGLTLIVLLLVLSLGSLVTGQTSNGTTDGTSGPVRRTRAEITELATSLLLLTLVVLLTSLLLEVL